MQKGWVVNIAIFGGANQTVMRLFGYESHQIAGSLKFKMAAPEW